MRTIALTAALLALAGYCRADDDPDPEPPRGAATQRLKGTWVTVRRITNGVGEQYTRSAYTFEKGKVIHATADGKVLRTMLLEIDRKRPDLLRMTPDKGQKFTYAYKLDKGELYFTPANSTDARAKPDFSGNTTTVLILQRQKK